MVGTDAKQITINDLAVNPQSGTAYLSVSRDAGPMQSRYWCESLPMASSKTFRSRMSASPRPIFPTLPRMNQDCAVSRLPTWPSRTVVSSSPGCQTKSSRRD